MHKEDKLSLERYRLLKDVGFEFNGHIAMLQRISHGAAALKAGSCSYRFTGLWQALYILHAIMSWIIFLKQTRMLHGYMTCLDLCRKLDCHPTQAIDHGYGNGGKRYPIKRSLLLRLDCAFLIFHRGAFIITFGLGWDEEQAFSSRVRRR